MNTIKSLFSEIAIPYAKDIRKLIKDNSEKPVDMVNIGQLYGGMRDVISIVTETSMLDPEEGIFFRGFSIKKLYELMPKNAYGSAEPLPEMMLGLMLLGRIPTEVEIQSITKELHERAVIPKHVIKILDSLPKEAHPMVQLTTAFSALNSESIFNKSYYAEDTTKDKFWEYIYEDALNIIASAPIIGAYIYNRIYNNGKQAEADKSLDWAGNLAHMVGDSDSSKTSLMKEFLRLHLSVHSDHEGGNASAYTAHVVGSTLASPYGAYSAAMHALAGPLHGLASQTSLEWVQSLITHYNGKPTKENIKEFINITLEQGKVVPGYGHAVLRIPDPRFLVQMNFAKKHNMSNDILETVWNIFETAPKILGNIAKIKNPFPNVDAHSGAVLYSLGFKNPEFYTVFFGISRSIGIMSQQIWDRVLRNALTRPKSVTSEWVKNHITNK